MNVEIGNEAAQSLFWEYINLIFFAVRAEHLLSPIHQHRGLIWTCSIDSPSPLSRFPTSPTSGRSRTWPWVWWSPPCVPPPRPAPSPRNSLSQLQNAPVKMDIFVTINEQHLHCSSEFRIRICMDPPWVGFLDLDLLTKNKSNDMTKKYPFCLRCSSKNWTFHLPQVIVNYSCKDCIALWEKREKEYNK